MLGNIFQILSFMISYLFTLLVHVFAAMFWVGGIIFYVLVIISVIRDPDLKNVKLKLLEKTALQFRKVSYVIFLMLTISGTFLLYTKGFLHLTHNIHESIFSIPPVFLLKILLFLVLLFSSLYHDFFSGPATFTYAESDPIQFEKFRKRSALFGRVNLLLSVTIAILGVLGSRGVMSFPVTF